MEDQQKIRYRLLNAALEKSDTIEQAIMATMGLERFIITGKFAGESADIEQEPKQQEQPPSKKPKRRKYKKYKFKYKKYKSARYDILGEEHYRKFLEAMIALKESGERVTIQAAAEIAYGGSTPDIKSAVSYYLTKHGYVEKRGHGGYSVKWTILKNPDGTPYEPTVLQVPTAEAKGYGWTQKLGDVARVKQ